MERSAHLWAVGYNDVDRAGQVWQIIVSLAAPEQYLELRDIATLVRSLDGSLTLNGDPFSAGKYLNSLARPRATVTAVTQMAY